MQRLTWITVLVILSVTISCTYGQDDDFLGLPIEYDIFGPDPYDTLYKERESTKEESSDIKSEDLLKRLCVEYDLQLENKILDCQNIRIVPKILKTDDHVLRKRNAEDESQLEGSGEPEEIAPANEENPPSSDSVAQEIPVQAPAETPAEENAVPDTPVDDVVPYGNTETDQVPAEESKIEPVEHSEVETQNNAEAPKPDAVEPIPDASAAEETKVEEPAQESAPETATDEESKNEPVVPYAQEESPSEDTQNIKEEPSNGTEAPAPDAANEQAKVEPEPSANEEGTNSEDQALKTGTDEEHGAEPAVPDVEQDKPSPPPTEATPKPEEPTVPTAVATDRPVEEQATTAVVKKGRILIGGVGAKEVEPSQEAEKLHEHQSGNAIINTSGAETLAGSDAAVKKMPQSENIKESTNADLPKSGESSEGTQQARKDSKVLIILLVAVVVIGGAAFAYNFIKKRKQKKSSDATRSENGGSAALQKVPEKDAEQGTELKPLMKNNEPKPVVEYKDEKDGAKTEAVN